MSVPVGDRLTDTFMSSGVHTERLIGGRYGLGVNQNFDEYSRPRLLESAPVAVIDYVRETVASRFLREQPAADGFTPSVASIITAEDDRQVFVKAGPKGDTGGEAVRTGAELAQVITDLGPALLSWAERDGWYVAVYERLAGAAVDEWRIADIECVAALSNTMRDRFDPCPLDDTVAYADAFAPLLGTWSALTDPGGPAEKSVEHVRNRDVPYGLRIETLAELEADWFAALRGGTSLQHGDIRRDNVMREPSGRLRLVDWTHRWTAPSWADWVRLVPDIAADGFDPERLFQNIAAPEAQARSERDAGRSSRTLLARWTSRRSTRPAATTTAATASRRYDDALAGSTWRAVEDRPTGLPIRRGRPCARRRAP